MLGKIVAVNKKWSDHCRIKNELFYSDVNNFTECLKEIIKKEIKLKYSILEAGGIDRPLWHKDADIIYDGLDIEYSDKCDSIYDNFFVQSIEDTINGKYDLIISRTLLEHVPDNRKSFNSIYISLNEDGKTIHYMPNKFHLYSIILRLVGDEGQRFLIKKFRPWAENTGYPTYFSYCSPRQMEKLLTEIGYKSIKIKCFYHANDYFSFCFPLFILVTLWENFCKKFNLETFCAGFILEADKKSY